MTKKPILLDLPMPITTDRLIIRLPEDADAPAILDAMHETLPLLKEWMEWAQTDPTMESVIEFIRNTQAAWIQKSDDTPLSFFCKQTGDYLGNSGFVDNNWKCQNFEIGYWCKNSAQGNGYVTEISNALTRYAFDAMDANCVQIHVLDGNDKSRAVPKRLGFEYLGMLPFKSTKPDTKEIVGRHIYYRTDLNGLPNLNVSW